MFFSEISMGNAEHMSQSLANEYCRHDAVIDVVRALAGYKTDSPESLAHDLRDIEFQTLSSYTDFFGNVLRQIHQNFGAATFFVEIGANDGKFADPLFEKVNAWKWRGLLVEPLEDVFRLLKQNYAHLPGLSFENSAIAEVVCRCVCVCMYVCMYASGVGG
mmetsp:Transcript_79962/g.213973  ORF Transcript_79962/g.213973 Transcript_79962/m.213973 type:complete len:161 (-) Transcript_79962:841-1323(-)